MPTKTGHKISTETRAKISAALKGKKLTNETLLRMSSAQRKRFSSDEARKKHSEQRKQSEWKATPEQIQKQSEAQMGHKRMAGYKHSVDARRAMGDSHRGDKNINWKGGVTPINRKIRSSLEYRLWRESVFERDSWTCVFCGARSKAGNPVVIHADHIKPFALFPELRFAIDNGRTLCEPCHKTTDTFGVKALKFESDKSVNVN